MRRMGIDEAGRGCVFGALYVGAFVTDTTDAAVIDAGARDSKQLSATKRARALDRLAGLGQLSWIAIPAVEIDGGNLNRLEEDAIVALALAARPDTLHIDALGHPRTLSGITSRLEARLADAGLQVSICMEPKADSTYPVVGAASICAKVHRDRALASLEAEHGPLGSGYPSDPVTRAWIEGWVATGAPWPAFVRTRWETIRTAAQQPLL